MPNLKKMRITTESREVFIVRMNAGSSISGFCPLCGKDVKLLTLDEAVSVSARRTRDLIREIESGAIHTIETESGHLLVCSDSLA